MDNIRIGIGYDIHQLEEGHPLIIGGIPIPSSKGSVAHSDGDALLHSIIDAILGATGKGDIGHFFPPDDPQWKDAKSSDLLNIILKETIEEKWRINNIDTIVILQNIRLKPFIPEIKTSLSSLLNLDEEFISIKAKTKERLDATGEGRAIECHASLILRG